MTDENSDIESQALALFEQALEGQKDEILKAAPEIIDIRRQQVQNNLGDIGYIQLLANALQISGEALLDTGEKKQGCIYIFEALEHVKAYAEKKAFSEVDKKMF